MRRMNCPRVNELYRTNYFVPHALINLSFNAVTVVWILRLPTVIKAFTNKPRSSPNVTYKIQPHHQLGS